MGSSASGAAARYPASPPGGTMVTSLRAPVARNDALAQVAARAATQVSAIATRAYGCHRCAMASTACAKARSPAPPAARAPAANPEAPTHHIPGAPATGETCGLASTKDAVAVVIPPLTASSSHV